jgi:hypothetical protein
MGTKLRHFTMVIELVILLVIEPVCGRYRHWVRAYRDGLWKRLWIESEIPWMVEESR